jgi:uncharacterized membrane protein YcaP (DUF421 family)
VLRSKDDEGDVVARSGGTPMPDWSAVLEPSLPILEIVVRGTLVFLALTVLFRVVGQRESGALALTDLLVIVLVAEAVSHAMTGGYHSVTEGLVLVVTILFWSVLLDAVAYRYPPLGRWLKARPKPLITDGVVNRKAMRREFLSDDELASQLRLHGVSDVRQVARAFLEPNGMISVFRSDGEEVEEPPEPNVAA